MRIGGQKFVVIKIYLIVIAAWALFAAIIKGMTRTIEFPTIQNFMAIVHNNMGRRLTAMLEPEARTDKLDLATGTNCEKAQRHRGGAALPKQ